jgi:hypothetical protein
VEQKTSKYTNASRVSPPYPANICKGQVMQGNDRNWWMSVPDKNNVHRWKRSAPATKAASRPAPMAAAAMPAAYDDDADADNDDAVEQPKHIRKQASAFASNPFQSGLPSRRSPSASPAGSPAVSRAASPVMLAKKAVAKPAPSSFNTGGYIDASLLGPAVGPASKARKAATKPGKDESSWELDSLIKIRPYDGKIFNPNSKSWVSPSGALGQSLLKRMRFVEEFKRMYASDYNL